MQRLLNNRAARYTAFLVAYAFIAAAALAAAYFLRFDGEVPGGFITQFLMMVSLVTALQVGLLVLADQARVLPSFFSLVDVRAILVATTASSALLFCFSEFLLYQRIPRGGHASRGTRCWALV